MGDNSVKADVLVVGSARGGKIVAVRMGQLGERVVLVERSPRMYGGTCPNVGCVPTEEGAAAPVGQAEPARAAAAGVRELGRRGAGAHRTAPRRQHDALNGADTVTVVAGHATVLGPHTVGIGVGSDQLTIDADTILINRGSEPVIPDIPGLRESRHMLTSTDLIETSDLPERLAIVGGDTSASSSPRSTAGSAPR